MQQFDKTYDDSRLAEIRRAEEESLTKQLAPRYGIPYVNLIGVTINPEALRTIDEATAKAAQAVGFEKQNKILNIAIKNPNKPETKTLLSDLRKKWTVNIALCSTASLEHAWKRYYDQGSSTAVKRGILDINIDTIEALTKKIKGKETVTEHIISLRSNNSAKRVSETLEVMFAGALALKASDIHIEPEESGVRLRYRVDGVLQDIIDLENLIYKRLMSRLKILSGMLLNKHDEAQDGRFSFVIGEKEIDVRSSLIPGAYGESMVMRLLDPSVASFTFEDLGMNERLRTIMEQELARPNGMVITTGPTGSGKTTALYAFLRKVHTPDRKIITIENPVEYKIDDIVQTQVSDDYTFSSGLRAILRQDPDVIMLGEIRDREVAETAVHAAQTGHLVFSTLHTNNAVGAFPRLIDLGVDYHVLGSALNIVLAQRLVRTLCEHCKKSRTATAAEQVLIHTLLRTHPQAPEVSAPFTIYDAGGCEACGYSGYKGRVGVFEAVVMDEAVEEAVLRDPREHIIAEAARPQQIPTMAEDGIVKVLEGTTSFDELKRVVDMPVTAADISSETGNNAPEKSEDDFFQKHVVN